MSVPYRRMPLLTRGPLFGAGLCLEERLDGPAFVAERVVLGR
jgi:hypothetical protein